MKEIWKLVKDYEIRYELSLKYIKNIFVGIHPEYKRKNDLIIQTELMFSGLSRHFSNNLDDLVKKVIDYKGSLI